VLSRRVFAIYATVQFIQTATVQRGTGETILRGLKVPPDGYLFLVRGYTLHQTFTKLFRDYAPAPAIALYDTFDRANGRELDELRAIAVANTGQAVPEAQLRRWIDLSNEITTLLGRVLSTTVDVVSAETDQMLSDARFAMFAY